MKRLLKRGIAILLYVTGITFITLCRRFRKRQNALVLLYHRIRKPWDLFEAAVSPENFEKQIRYVRKHFDIVPLDEIVSNKVSKRKSGKPLAAITFDDGYRDNLHAAYPTLKKYSVPATVFLAVGSIGNEEPMWTSVVEGLFRDAPAGDIVLETLFPSRPISLGNLRQRMQACHEIKVEMKKIPDSQRRLILKELEEKLGSVRSHAEEMLSWNEVSHMAQDPLITFGSHSVSHRMLANIPNAELHWELEESKKTIETKTGMRVRYMSYPGNSYNAQVQEAAKGSGYEAAFAVDQSLCNFTQDLFRLPRIHVEDEPLYVFQAEISLLLKFFRASQSFLWR